MPNGSDPSPPKAAAQTPEFAHLFPAPLTAWPSYLTDAGQRSLLFLDVLRRRGNIQKDMTARPEATVLTFGHEILLSGRSLPRPINYSLARILPPPGVVADPTKRPVVVVDPRAGQGPGIGGFKADSEIGDAVATGHPVYFIIFTASPEPGQQFLDVVEGQIKFFERIVERHPDAPRPFAIGNCQAGYQTLMVAMLRPDLFGPCMVAGSPISYWQGVRGKDPMRYSGGLLGGSWLTALTADLANGKFDGTWLVLNFDNLNPANWLWGKQYDVYANVDSGAGRYLEFEKWWGDFIELNGDELQFLVDNMFIGDRLTRGELRSSDGTVFDLRNIASPIIVFASMGDNISPPPQTLGWIADLYRDVDDIRALGRTIVYCMNPTVGHLAIFVSAKVGAKEDAEMVRLIDMIDCLPPGLYELVIEEAKGAAGAQGRWLSRLEMRTVDDIRAYGRNSPADDRAFAAAARLSELNLSAYRTFVQPFVRALANEPFAQMTKALNPLRLSYTMFSDDNPAMAAVKRLAGLAADNRAPAAPDNPFTALEKKASDRIEAALDQFRDARDRAVEAAFFAIYGSPIVQGLVGVNGSEKVRQYPTLTPERLAARAAKIDQFRAAVGDGGPVEALLRGVMFVIAADGGLDERSGFALARAREEATDLTLAEFKAKIREQFYILLLERERAVAAIADLVATASQRRAVYDRVAAIVAAGGAPTAAETQRLETLAAVLNVAVKPAPRKGQPG